MANELQPLSLLFQNRLFRIPDYQRGYAWQQTHLTDFWEDLVNLQIGRYHYTGLLSLKTLKRSEVNSWGTDLWMIDKGFKPCHIVDGQQRLTTCIILLNEIVEFVRELEENKSKEDSEIILGDDTLQEVVEKYVCKHRPSNKQIITYLFGYEVDNPSAEYLRHRIFGEPFSGEIHETYYTKNLKFAKAFFRKNISSWYAEQKMEGITQLYLKLTLNFMFNIHEIDDDYDVFVAFETMNNRGKKLTNLELLKNRLIYLTTLYPDQKFDELDKADLRKKINDAWKEVYYQLGRNENTPLPDDDFLRAHWSSYFTYSRKTGDDYIRFLLKKFSSKQIFEKRTVAIETTAGYAEQGNTFAEDEEEAIEHETVDTEISKLEPEEIASYVNSLKDMAKYWYDTFFPSESDHLNSTEKLWVDRLNRIGIGHFRPFVMVLISRRDISSEKRIEAFKAIERFLFICFRIGSFNTSFKSSEYYRAARSIYLKEMDVDSFIDNIEETTNANIEYALPNFVTRIEKLFADRDGFYSWNSIRYFLFEYELHLAQKNNLDKVSWSIFTKVEKDSLSIEHILPQTPTKYYWRNQFRQFDTDEISLLSGALGNLLPLSQRINSALQNDSFHDKKVSKNEGRRGYENGSHSEIEVSKESDWSAERIYNRSKKLLQFMENRWQISFTSEQMEKLIYVTFAIDGRPIPPELPNDIDTSGQKSASQGTSLDASSETMENTLGNLQVMFWSAFVEYCQNDNREDIGCRKPQAQNWYDIPVMNTDFHLSFTITRGKFLSLLIYAYNQDAFKRLEGKKAVIEEKFGNKLDWYSSREKSIAKRIVYKRECEIFNPEKQNELFAWMIDKYDLLCNALMSADEMIELNNSSVGKFDSLKQYLLESGLNEISLAFSEIETILGEKLCKSAYVYISYWHPAPTHTLANAIVGAGYKMTGLNLGEKRVFLKKDIDA